MSQIELTRKNLNILDQLDIKLFPGEDPCYKKNKIWWLLYNEDNPIGFAGLKIIEQENIGFLCRSGIYKKYRGQGLQKELIFERELYSKKIGLNKIITYTSKDNLPSANNLINCGYKLYEPENIWGLPREKCLYFYKDL